MFAFLFSSARKVASICAGLVQRIGSLAGYSRMDFRFADLRCTITQHLKLDVPIAIITACYLIVFLPVVPRNTANPQLMAAFANDEPFLTMALEAMAVRPYGNPANYLDPRRRSYHEIPSYWGEKRYPNIFYYGGGNYLVSFPFYAVGRIIGLPTFQTAAIVLRLVSLLSGLGCLVVLYNFFKLRGSRLAGGVAAACIFTDAGFNYLVTFIHPDALQFFLGLLALAFATRHARRGDVANLVGLGIVCGLVQGTKVGGPWLAPMAALAVAFGVFALKGKSASPDQATNYCREVASGRVAPLMVAARHLVVRCMLLGLAGVIAFFVSTPYAAVDSYYWQSLLATIGIVGVSSPIGVNPTLLSWSSLFYAQIGTLIVVFAGLGAVRAIVGIRRSAVDVGLILALTVAVSQLLWFGITGKLWHVISYLLLAQGLVTGIAIETMVEAARRIRDLVLPVDWKRIRAGVAAIAANCMVVFFLNQRWDVPVQQAIAMSQGNTVRAVGDWAASGGLPRNSKILFDDLAYFDAAQFPNARMHGGVLTWPQLEVARPDIVVLSSSLYGAEWYVNLRKTQHHDRWNPDPFSMRLYQDLLSTDQLGKTSVPGVELIKIVRPVAHKQESRLATTLLDAETRLPAWAQGTLSRIAQIVLGLKALLSPPSDPPVGPELRVFRLGPAGAADGRPAGFAVGSAEGVSASLAFDSSAIPWRCGQKGDAAMTCAVGFDFGEGAAVAVRQLRVQWPATEDTPSALRLEFSDDNARWTEAATLDVAGAVASVKSASEQLLRVPDSGRHRSWRVSPLGVREGGGFAVAEMAFLE